MKMSLCNTFRFFAVFATIALSVVGSPIPGLVNRQENIATKYINQDLDHQGSITVELKSDIKRPNDINSLKSNNVKDDTNSITLNSEGTKKSINKNSYKITPSKDIAAQYIAKHEQRPTQIPQEVDAEVILLTTVISQQAETTINITSSDENTNLANNAEIPEIHNSEKKSIKEDFRSENNDIISENQTDVSTDSSNTTELDYSTVTLLDINAESTINTKEGTETSSIINTEDIILAKSAKSIKPSLLLKSEATPSWKKYTAIERKKVTATVDDLSTLTDTSIPTDPIENVNSTIFEEPTTITDKSEVMVKSESAQGRISLQDAITSDIPSLEKLKSDLLSFPNISTESDIESITRLLSTEESITDTTTLLTTAFPFIFNSELPNTVSSKRAGYIDLSVKNITEKDNISLKPNGTQLLQGTFDMEIPDTQGESLDDKVESKVESQSQLTEDAIKEELLKEEMLNDNEAISKPHREDEKLIETDRSFLHHTDKNNVTHFDDKFVQPPHTAPDENLSVKPINSDKAKNTVLYPVNPNYKPLKKIEVQPAKSFVRDPDDNSWRNESLSSLGIVFKPKNSSKPFTQVLKNKTETEWNNLSEKDIKSEVPDLRVRLEQIAQKRKSKKKKIDSFGNVFYTDYEENNNSEENTTTPQVEDPFFGTFSTTDASTSGITIVTPNQTTSLLTSTTPVPETNDVPALTTTPTPTHKTQNTPKKEPTKFTTLKPAKMFNLFDYYETNDDEDIADYLNMAKIDLKKFTVPLDTTYTPYTSPPTQILYTNPTTQYTPERKGTIQYFPPRTTKTPKKIKHSNTRDRINPLALTDSSKHVLPISYHKSTTPYDNNMYYTNNPETKRLKDDIVPKNFERNLYLTTPPLTTIPEEDFSIIGNEGGYNRPNYVIKHFKDYINEAAQEHEHSKQQEYAFTEPPAHDISLTDLIKPTTMKDKTTVPEEYDYESVFRKDILDRFVANFNEKSNRFKSDYPVVYNNSIVHGASYDEKDVAMSRAYFRRPNSNPDYKPIVREFYDPNCENVTVELSPAYELHYYVPEQEEKQEVEGKPINLPVRYRL